MTAAKWISWFYVGVILFSLSTLFLHSYNPIIVGWMTREDSLLESLSAVLYLAAAGIFFLIWERGGYNNLLILGYGLLFLFVGGEEISWGQRIFSVTTPESLAHINVQRETNLHNIDGIHQHIRKVGVLLVIGIAIVMPMTKKWSVWFQGLYARFSLPVVPLWTVPLTVLAIMFMVVPRILGGDGTFRFDEIGEFYLSVTFLLFALHERSSVSEISKSVENWVLR